MSDKRYIRNCDQCTKEYVAKTTRSRFCTTLCKANWHRLHKEELLLDQAKIIKEQTKIIKKAGVPNTTLFAAWYDENGDLK